MVLSLDAGGGSSAGQSKYDIVLQYCIYTSSCHD